MPIPQYQSLDQIISNLSTGFVTRLNQAGIVPGLQDLKAGSPFLAIFHAVGQCRMRGQMQNMETLDANNIDSPAADLDRIGAGLQIPRLGQTYANGTVTISDISFNKISSRLYHGQSAPIPGNTSIYIVDGSSFPSSGQIYIGRGTNNFEGPLTYSAISNVGSGWLLTLTGGISNFHAVTESVTLAQGGDRTVGVGQTVRTSQSSVSGPISFATAQLVTIPDGETTVQAVPVVCSTPGSIGNVPAGSIKEIVSPAFDGMSVTNPGSIQNGRDAELDDAYRARIKATKASSQLATKVAIETKALGLTSPDESSSITAATLVRRNLYPTALIIDDSSGYEAKTDGVAYEVIVDSALGGETTFSLIFGRPVAKAGVVTIASAPYSFLPNSILAVEVGGIHSEHMFGTDAFRAIGNTSAFEVVASINADSTLPYSARTVNGGTKVEIFAKTETAEDIKVIAPYTGTNANDVLSFPLSRVSTLSLYKNDRLLSKDGRLATLSTQSQSTWSPMSGGETLVLNVDGTGPMAITFNDIDFINADTGYTSVSASNSLTAWTKVFNAKIPGVTTAVNGGFMVLTSNKGRSGSASLTISDSSTLVAKGMFNASVLTSTGSSLDYVLDRNLGQIELSSPLAEGDRLTASTPFTRAYIESDDLPGSTTIPADGASMWFFVDGAAANVPVGLNANVYLSPSTSAGNPCVTITARSVSTTLPVPGVFSGVSVNDWYINTVDDAPVGVRGAWRVCEVDAAGAWFQIEIPWASYTLADSTGLAFAATRFVNSTARPQMLTLPAGTYTPAQIAASLELVGGSVSAVGNKLRIATDTYSSDGDIALRAQNTVASTYLLLPVGLVSNSEPHTTAVSSGNQQLGTPSFKPRGVSSFNPTGCVVTAMSSFLSEYREGHIEQVLFAKPKLTGALTSRASTLNKFYAPPSSITSSSVFSLPVPADSVITNADFTNAEDYMEAVSCFRFGPESYLTVTMNQDPIGLGFNIPMFRRLVPDTAVPYGSTLRLQDADLLESGLPTTLDHAFGTSFDFANFALHMRARGVTHPADSTKSIMWRKQNFSGSVAASAVRYVRPSGSATPMSISRVEPNDIFEIQLPTGAARTLTFGSGNVLYHTTAQKAIVSAYGVSSITRSGGSSVSATLSAPFSMTAGSGMSIGSTVWIEISSANFTSGWKTLTGAGGGTISWTEAGSNVTESPVGATASWDSLPMVFTGVEVGDYSTGWSGRWGATSTVTFGIAATDTHGIQIGGTDPFSTSGTTTLSSGTDFEVYPICVTVSGSLADLSANQMVTLVNALGAGISGTYTGDGTGIITQDYSIDSAATVLLADGIAQIASSSWNSGVGNYDLLLKFSPSVGSIDYDNEQFRLVPTTAKNLQDLLSTSAVTGFDIAGGEVTLSEQGGHLQLTSETLGSSSAIQVTGGSANHLAMTVAGAASTVSSYLKIPVTTTADINTLPTMCWAQVQATKTVPKSLNWTSSSTLTFSSTNNQVTVGVAGTAWAYTQTPVISGQWYIEKHGRYVSYQLQGGTGLLPNVHAGDWAVVDGGASRGNQGRFRVVYSDGECSFWIENPDCLEEDVIIDSVRFFTFDSVMPGDIFNVGTSAFGSANQGQWIVSHNDAGLGDNTHVFFLTNAITNNGPTVVGTNLSYLRVLPAAPVTSYGRIRTWIPDSFNSNVINLFLDFTDTTKTSLVGLAAGATVVALDRLEFPTTLNVGLDGYRHHIGLIAAANQVLYGDESDPETYPGVISANDKVFIQPPLLRRTIISVAVREVSGANTKPAVQAAIAKVINSSGGKSVPISSYLAEAQKVTGVISIVPISPVATADNDVIVVQPDERATIVDVDRDIQVTIIGA